MYCCTTQGGQALGAPDLCKTPMPPAGQPVPVPYPNTGMPMMGQPTAKKVMISGMPALNKSSKIPVSNGDNAGVGMGVTSGTVMGEVEFTASSTKVKIEGAFAVRLGDVTAHNKNNIVGACIAPSQTKVMAMS